MAFSDDGEYAGAPAPFPIVVNGTVMAGRLGRVARKILYSFKIRVGSNPEWHIELKAKVKSSRRHMKGILCAGCSSGGSGFQPRKQMPTDIDRWLRSHPAITNP